MYVYNDEIMFLVEIANFIQSIVKTGKKIGPLRKELLQKITLKIIDIGLGIKRTCNY